jgi:hypothetical protein
VQLAVADQAQRLGGLGQVHADEVGLGQQLVQGDEAGAELGGPGGGHVRVVGDHLHAERGQPLGDQRADPAQPEEAGHFVLQLDAGELGAFPLAGLERGHGLWHVAGDGQQQRHRVLGRAHDVGARRVHDHDPRLGGGLHVHVVQAYAGPRDHAQLRRTGQCLRVDLGGAADDDRVRVRQRGQQCGPVCAVHLPHDVVSFELADRGG